jgi:hypothetical protein
MEAITVREYGQVVVTKSRTLIIEEYEDRAGAYSSSSTKRKVAM